MMYSCEDYDTGVAVVVVVLGELLYFTVVVVGVLLA